MKKRIRRGDPRKQAHWQEVLRRWKESGRSVRAYCRAEGLRESAFYFWRGKLERCSQPSDAVIRSRPKASQVTPASPSPKRSSPPHRGVVSFLPVRVVGPASGCPAAAEASDTVEIVLAHGRRVRVRSGFDRQTLVDVLAVLEVRPC
jgi:transposase